MSLYKVREVVSGKDLKEYIHFPYTLYKHCTYWVPPLLSEQKKLLDISNHPVYNNITVRLLLCEKDGKVAGRIAYIENDSYTNHWGERTAFFGFFDSINDREVASRLFDSVEAHCKENGYKSLLGPFNPNINYSCGILVNCFDSANSIMMPYNYDYYHGLLEECRFSKAKDLHAYYVDSDTVKLDLLDSLEKRVSGSGITYRGVDNDLKGDVIKITEIFNEAWSQNWGFVPIAVSEAGMMADDLKHVIHKDLVVFAKNGGRDVGFIMAIPDINVVLKGLNGKLFPFGWLKLLIGLRRVRKIRVITLGVVTEYRNTVIPYVLIKKLIENGFRNGFTDAELSWILEDNTKMVKPLLRIGAELRQVFRIYEKDIT